MNGHGDDAPGRTATGRTRCCDGVPPRSLLIALMSTLAGAPATAHGDQGHRLSIHGADVSSLHKSEDFGGVYRDARGRRGDALDILTTNGLDWIRLRVLVDPADGYHDTAELLGWRAARSAQGSSVLVDFHYSDFWADPGKQWTPAAWEGLSFDALSRPSPRTRATSCARCAPGHAARHGPARQRDQPGPAVGLRGDLDRLLDRRRRHGRHRDGLPHGELGQPGASC